MRVSDKLGACTEGRRAFARELKDRWLEQVQREPALLASSAAKYAVRQCLEAATNRESEAVVMTRLDAA